MKRILLIAIVALAFTLPAFAQKRSADRRDKAEQELRNLVRAWDDADVKGEAAVGPDVRQFAL